MSNISTFLQKEVTVENLPLLLSDLGLLPAFIRRVLLRKFASDIQPSKDEQINYQKKFFISQRITDNDSLKNWLKKNSISEGDMSLHLFRSLQTDKLKSKLFGDKVESFFLNNREKYDFCYFSLLRTRSRESITELFLRLKEEEETFSALATQFSVGSESQSNGYIGPKIFSEIHPEFTERLRISQPGQLWEPFQVDSFWCVLRLERIIKSSLNNQLFSRILDELFEDWISQKVDDELASFLHLTAPTSPIVNYADTFPPS